MKSLLKHSLFTLLFCFFFLSCSKEDLNPVRTGSAISISKVIDPCATCEYQDLIKTVSKKTSTVGSVAICQTATELTITFTVSGSRERAWFQQTGYGVYGVEPTSLNPSPTKLTEKDSHHGDKLRSVSYTIPLADLGDFGAPGTTIYIAAYAVVPGSDGDGGMIWAGNRLAQSGNPNSRYFAYTIKQCETPEPPTGGCLFTQGYWFAKPDGSQWPVSSILFGGQTYTYLQAKNIFFGSNGKTGKTAAKQAFLQGLALKLSLEGGAESCSEEVTDALRDIEAHFAAISTLVTATNINSNTFNTPNSSGISLARLREAASLISDCLKTHHCNQILPGDLVELQ